MRFAPKLIVLDLDGTALDSTSSLTRHTIDVLHRAMDKGIKVMVATGRMCPSALPIIRTIGTDLPCIFYNGAIIKDPVSGKTLFKQEIGSKVTSEVADFYHDNGWYLQRYYNDRLYVVDDNDERCKFYVSIAKVPAYPLGADFWSERSDSIKLLGIADGPDEFERMVTLTREHFLDRLYVATSWKRFVEMVNRDVNKAKSVAKVAAQLDIESKYALAIGDSTNDREMIEWAGLGIAMGNADQELKNAADEIAPDNVHDGAASVIERFL